MKRLVTVMLASLSTLLIGGAAPAAQPRFDLPATVARFDALYRSIMGNVTQRRASELLNHHRIEGGIAACMQEHGRPYRKAPFVSSYQDFTDADLGYGNGSASIIDSLTAGTRRWELNAIAGARLARAGAHDRDVRPEDAEIANKCAEPFEYRTYPDFDPPAGAYRLTSFTDLLEPVLRDARVRTAWHGYHACMKDRHGYVIVGDRSDFLFAPSARLTEPPVDGLPAGPQWHRALAELKAVFAADVDCRRPAYIAAMKIVADRLDGWQTRHRAELETIRKAWNQRIDAAAKLPR